MDLLVTLLYIVFVLSAIVLIVVILLQEGKGGGFGQALGDHGQQTFGVGAKGINTFTGYTATVFLVAALFLHIMNRRADSSSVLEGLQEAPVVDELGTGAGGPGFTVPPAGGSGASGQEGK